MFQRHPHNPLIRPQDVQPSSQELEVIGTFNAGVTTFQDEILLLIRVAERPAIDNPDLIRIPFLNDDKQLEIREIRRDDPAFDVADPRVVVHKSTGDLFLTSISHLRLARSQDGVHFRTDPTPWLQPTLPEETFGIEDARITCIDGVYYVNYTAVSPRGIATGLASTTDFVHIQRHGIIFPPANRDVTIFPVRIGEKYICYHRPMPGMFGGYNIWAAESPDLIHWGNHRVVLTSQAQNWESGRIGGGAPPIWTERGWLSIYHAADQQDRYCLGAFLTAHDDPTQVISRTTEPIFSPEAPYEVEGFFGNVVFTCGAILQGDTLRLYYGAADETVALAETSLNTLLSALEGNAH